MRSRTMTVAAVFSLGIVFSLGLVGCGESQSLAPPSAVPPQQVQSSENKLFWPITETVPGTDVEIRYGHFGDHFHAGDVIEAVVTITQAGEPVEDAIVSNQLFDPANPNQTKSPSFELEFQPASGNTIGHYGQAALQFPKDTEKGAIRFTIKLPGQSELIQQDMIIKLGH